MKFSDTLNQLPGKDRLLFMRMLIQHIFQKAENEIINEGQPRSAARFIYQNYTCLMGVKFSFSIQKDYKSFGALPFLKWQKKGVEQLAPLINKKDFLKQAIQNPLDGRAPNLKLIYDTVVDNDQNKFLNSVQGIIDTPIFFFRYELYSDAEQGYPLAKSILCQIERNKLLKLAKHTTKKISFDAL